MNYKNIGIIPVRLESTRVKTKALQDICGLPMIIHVLKRAQLCDDLTDVYVATDSKIIYDLVLEHGGKAIMTSTTHNNGSERIAEAAEYIDSDFYTLINGDEALVDPNLIPLGAKWLSNNSSCDMVLLMNKFYKKNDPSKFKLVLNTFNEILYISRNDIPSDARNPVEYYHKGYHIMTFTKKSLNIYKNLKESALEKIEMHELLRFIEEGYKIKGILVNSDSISVDTPSDLIQVTKLMKKDKYFKLYGTK